MDLSFSMPAHGNAKSSYCILCVTSVHFSVIQRLYTLKWFVFQAVVGPFLPISYFSGELHCVTKMDSARKKTMCR